MSSAHTAEHIFLGSLTRLLRDISVQKVEVKPEKNTVYVRCPSLDWEIILEAEKMTNRIISEGRSVMAHHYPSLEDAKKAIPSLRAHEERISGVVRVIEVEGYDYSACTGEHVKNTEECGFFIITRLVKAGKDLFEMEFEVGEKAKDKALEISKTCMKTAEILGATLTTLERTALNLKNENLNLKERLVSLTLREAEKIPYIEKGGVKFYVHIFEGLDTKRLMDQAGELVKQDRVIVIFANKEEKTMIILARSHDLKMDCGRMLRETLPAYQGKGGGKPEYAFGTIPTDQLSEAVKDLQVRVEEHLTSA